MTLCKHDAVIIEEPCCTVGYDCDCRGLRTLICPADDCQGITEDEAIEIMEGHYA